MPPLVRFTRSRSPEFPLGSGAELRYRVSPVRSSGLLSLESAFPF